MIVARYFARALALAATVALLSLGGCTWRGDVETAAVVAGAGFFLIALLRELGRAK